jgi:uncharacterized protein YndB with AHSA1/START domain
MSVLKEPGKRSIQLEIEVPGTPEEVWQAIATGNGQTAWFTRTDVEEREGGTLAHYMGGGASSGTVTGWDPPRRFAYEGPNYMPGAPNLATEIHVEARPGGTCVVRLVNSLFTDASDWDGQLEDLKGGWPTFLAILRIYMTSFAGQRAAMRELAGFTEGPKDAAFGRFLDAAGLGGAPTGARVATGNGAPLLNGVVEPSAEKARLVRIESPVPGVAYFGAHDCGGPVMVWLNLYVYGENAEADAARLEPAWRAWMTERFPMPAMPEGQAGEGVEAGGVTG